MIRGRSLLLAASFVRGSAARIGPAVTNMRFGILRTLSDGVFEFASETRRIPWRLKGSGFRFGVGFDNPDGSTYDASNRSVLRDDRASTGTLTLPHR